MAKSKSSIEDFSDDVMTVINKKFKDTPNAFEFLSQANMVTDWCSTGCTELDLAISNRPYGGLGFGLIYEILGLSQSSKSLLAAHIMSETQKLGGLAVLYDTEKAIGMLDFYNAIGLDTTKVLYTDKLRTVEEIFASIESIIERSYLKNPDKPITIVVDSIMGATTLIEQESDYEKDGYSTTKAIVLSKAMRKIPDLIKNRKIMIVLVNQLRDNMNAMPFGEKHQTSGGKAVGFTSSVRIKTSVVKKIKGKINGIDAEIGNIVEARIVKNRLGPPGRKAQFTILYESGIDDASSFLECLKNTDVVKSSGSDHSFIYKDQPIKFMKRDFSKLLNDDPDMKKYLYDKLCEKYIMKYKSDNNYTDIEEDESDD